MKPTGAVTLLLMAICVSVRAADDTPGSAATQRYQVKNRSSCELPKSSRSPFWPIGWVKPQPTVSQGTNPGSTVPKAEFSEKDFVVTSILVGPPSIAIINGRDYMEGQLMKPLREGTIRPRVLRIADGVVLIQIGNKTIQTKLRAGGTLNQIKEEGVLSRDN